ncbi:type III pantothenate kinase [Wenyingzhuangia heitensis]|uniref:Type III pantothenate kinase n=1 Tax=Wenyingzhuangia heitensis TaxID=1487859 RepID=A0ABX0UC51_9FLAO|nr:type III pantothenate kinase [Wenyingzhuangia heitensis]NIJ44731.1 type III pantothenate kinase [Wenyingzhuangia heitensis]
MHLIIDEGNSLVKLAVFNKKQLLDFKQVSFELCETTLINWCKEYTFTAVIVSSVTDHVLDIFNTLPIKRKVVLSYKTAVPFKNLYKTPNTLGVDRIALMAAACVKYPKKKCLVIDVGTCITYDFINNKEEYIGGAISPGIEMRFKSMHAFTQKLPQLTLKEGVVVLEGTSTETCMYSGVLNGIVFEIAGMINSYEQKYGIVNIILTGGSAKFLYKQLKNSIFVNPNFLLEGLNEVLTYQSTDEAKQK